MTVIIVTVVVMVMIPTVALAASGAFTSASNATPAVKATNTASKGIGVQGTGKKFGVLSNGPLGVAAGKSLSCTGCVGPAALSAAAKAIQPLPSGASESGSFGAEAQYAVANQDAIVTSASFSRPVSGSITVEQAPSVHCSGLGHAASGYLCLYADFTNDVTYGLSLPQAAGGVTYGAYSIWGENGGGDAYAEGGWTVTAP